VRQVIRIFIADDQIVVREGIKRIIADAADMCVVGEGRVDDEISARVSVQPVDVLVVDPPVIGDSLERLKVLHQLQPWLAILAFSMHIEHYFAIRVFKAGAKGYLVKNSQPEELLQAIRKVAEGGRYASPVLAEHLIRSIAEEVSQPLHVQLSNREYQVLLLLASGKTVSAIGEELDLSVKTISTYRSRLLEKLHVHTTAELIHYAFQQGLVS
jgi:two-component system, NarL family, invasion response regulator UvrY